jgi:hypothetical protein
VIDTSAGYDKWLEYFYEHADFGPAHEDVVDIMLEQFEKETGIKPEKWWLRGK